MSAAWVQAIAESVGALAGAGLAATWLWRGSRRYLSWRRRKKRDEVLSYVVPASVITLVIVGLLFGRRGPEA